MLLATSVDNAEAFARLLNAQMGGHSQRLSCWMLCLQLLLRTLGESLS